MKQVIQAGKELGVFVEEVPDPLVRPHHLLVRTTRSLISSGTERSAVESGSAGYVARARQQPDRVRKAVDKLRTDGLGPTIEVVRQQTKRTLTLGYSSVGIVVAVGDGVHGFQVGQRVACNGPHAELAVVPAMLCAAVPDSVPDEHACFTVLGAVALQGIRLAEPALGERVAVIGMGLVGQLVARLLRAHGAKVIGFDRDPERVRLASAAGASAHLVDGSIDPVSIALHRSDERGVDAVIVAASSTTSEILHQAANMCRQRGRVVIVGAVQMNLRRADFYEKELTLQVSCSYGPGRYDNDYEEGGIDYPPAFVRWTAQRNFAAVLGAMESGQLDVSDLVSSRFAIANVTTAYEHVIAGSVVGVVLEYPEHPDLAARPKLHLPSALAGRSSPDSGGVAVVGTGGFARGVLIPALVDAGTEIRWLVSAGGVSSATSARQFGGRATTDLSKVLEDPGTSAVLIATRHESHARLAESAIRAGKAVYVEKPLAITVPELSRVHDAYLSMVESGHSPVLMVGFNRRFASLVADVRRALENRSRPIVVSFTCNAGQLAPSHWAHDLSVGGGRLVGEAGHFIDLIAFIVGTPITSVAAIAAHGATASRLPDTSIIQLSFNDGSIGAVQYLSNGSSKFPKERLEVFSDGRVLLIDNFTRLRAWGAGRKLGRRLRSQDKGHAAAIAAFLEVVRTGEPSPMSYESILQSSAATLAVPLSIETGSSVDIDHMLYEMSS